MHVCVCHFVSDVNLKQNSQNRHETTRAGVVQKAPDTFIRCAYWTPICLKGVYWTPPTDRHDTAMTRNDTHVFLDSKKMSPLLIDTTRQ